MKPEDRKKPHRATSEIPIILDDTFYSDLEQTILKVKWPNKSEHKDIFSFFCTFFYPSIFILKGAILLS